MDIDPQKFMRFMLMEKYEEEKKSYIDTHVSAHSIWIYPSRKVREKWLEKHPFMSFDKWLQERVCA